VARNFYGALKVREIAADRPELAYFKLNNGRISHGAQYRAAENRRFPSQYYYPASGIGLVLAAPHTQPRRVGVAGLGVGTLAAYADAGDSYSFYEINPRVIEFADQYFSYLSDARDRFAKITIVPGDARLMLERQEPQNFDVLALDAFTSDAIPSHLLTLEAINEYLRHLRARDGVLAVHVSHRYLRLSLVLRAAAEKLKLVGRVVDAPPDATPAGQPSTWVLLYRPDASIAERQLGAPLEADAPERAAVVWTDDYNSILEVLGRSGE
jgi:spermidine synthase